jgi:hypothetical protein
MEADIKMTSSKLVSHQYKPWPDHLCFPQVGGQYKVSILRHLVYRFDVISDLCYPSFLGHAFISCNNAVSYLICLNFCKLKNLLNLEY